MPDENDITSEQPSPILPEPGPVKPELETITQEFVDLLKQNAVEVGQEFIADLDDLRTYTATIMTHLSAAVGQPGFNMALRAARDSVALKSANNAVASADKIDGRILGFVEGALLIASRAVI